MTLIRIGRRATLIAAGCALALPIAAGTSFAALDLGADAPSTSQVSDDVSGEVDTPVGGGSLEGGTDGGSGEFSGRVGECEGGGSGSIGTDGGSAEADTPLGGGSIDAGTDGGSGEVNPPEDADCVTGSLP